MSELNFIETNAENIKEEIISTLENGCSEPLYPGDERRIFGEALTQVVVAIYNKVNDGCRQKMLRYARNEVLDALGENKDVERIEATCATTILQFGVNEKLGTNIIIPAGMRVTGDFEHYFTVDQTVILEAGDLIVEVTATAENGGSDYNDIAPGQINQIVDISDAPLIDYVTNLKITSGGSDEEDDDTYRERIRESENKLSTAGPEKAYRYWALSANPKISDVVIKSEEETIERKLKNYGGYAFKGGSDLLQDTLVVYKSENEIAQLNEDYIVEYEDDLLIIILSESLRELDEINIKINRTMEGCVKIVPICEDGTIPDEGVLEDILQTCSASDVRPLTDKLVVEEPKIQFYDIDLIYYTTQENESEVIENIEGENGAINQYINWQSSSLNQDINPDKLRKFILAPEDGIGAERVVINKPDFREIDSTTVAKFSGSLKVSHVTKG